MSVPVRFDQLLPPRQAKIRQNLQTLASKGASDDEIESYLRDDEHLSPPGQKTMLDVRPDVSSALPPNRENPSGDAGPLLRGTAANVLSAAQAIPGMEAVEAGAGALGSHLPWNVPFKGSATDQYKQSLAALRGETNAIPAPIKMAGQALFAAPLAARWLPAGASPAKVGAGLGAADQALAADPIQSVNDLETRAGRTAAGAAIGGTVGKVLDLAGTAMRVKNAPNTSQELLDRINARKAASASNYGSALAEGVDKATPDEVTQFLNERDIQPIVTRLQATRQYGSMAPSDPRFLDRIYKELTDIGQRAGRTVESGTGAVNSAGLTRGEVGSAKEQLLNAIGQPGHKAPLHLDVAAQTYETDPLIESARPRLEGPTPRTSVEPPPMETGAQQSAREALQRRSGLAAARQAGPIEGQAVEEAGNRPVIRPPAQQPTPEFVVPERQEKVITPGVSVTTPEMRIQTAPAEELPPVSPSYRNAVLQDAQRRAEEQAFIRGKMASKLSGRLQTPTAKQDQTITPQAMARSYGPTSGAREAERQAAIQGIYSNTQGAIGRSGGRIVKRLLMHQANPLSGANELEKSLNPSVTEDLIRLLGTANAPVANP